MSVARRFACTGCGRCCYGGPDRYVALTRADLKRLQSFLALDALTLRRRYLLREDAGHGLRFRADGRCVFLARDGRCRVYAARPRQCRMYPLWPELLRSAGAWREEAKRCEGIGRGEVIPISRVRRVLGKA